jgi:hypothetical protein
MPAFEVQTDAGSFFSLRSFYCTHHSIEFRNFALIQKAVEQRAREFGKIINHLIQNEVLSPITFMVN